MKVGFNYPMSFNRFGADIGPNPHCSLRQWVTEQSLVAKGTIGSVPLPPLFENLDRNLANLKRMGIYVVRFFLLANGFNWLGHGPILRGHNGANPALPYHNWEFSPLLSLDPRFALHFEKLLASFRNAELLIIPSLISFEFTGNSRMRDEKGLAPGGRADCIKDTGKRQIFLSTVLNTLLNASARYKQQIYAWEIINEPYWCYSPIGPLSKAPSDVMKANPDTLVGFARQPEVDQDEMNIFIGEAIQLINSKGFPSTVGHRFFRDLEERKPLDWQTFKPPQSYLYYAGSKPQFHYYAKPALGFGDPYQIKDQGLFNAAAGGISPKPFLGEFDSDLNSFGNPWPELQGNDTTLRRLQLLESQGCELALLWPDKGTPSKDDRPDPIKLASVTRQAVVNFTGGTMPSPNE